VEAASNTSVRHSYCFFGCSFLAELKNSCRWDSHLISSRRVLTRHGVCLNLLEAWMIRINSNELPSKMCIPLDKELRTGNSSADEAPFEGINEAGVAVGKKSKRDRGCSCWTQPRHPSSNRCGSTTTETGRSVIPRSSIRRPIVLFSSKDIVTRGYLKCKGCYLHKVPDLAYVIEMFYLVH